MPSVTIEILGRQHKDLLKDFRNQHQSLEEYLPRFARRHIEKDLLARTYLAIDRNQGSERIAGYFSLTTVSVERKSMQHIKALEKLPGFPIPGVLLARLAVDTRVQRQGLGRHLFEEALSLTLQLARSGPVAFRLFVTDAIDLQAAQFYERAGMQREYLSDSFPTRMVLDLKPLIGHRAPVTSS